MKRPATVAAALLFGFAGWTTLVIAIAGRACTAQFDIGEAVMWWSAYTILGFTLSVPLILLFAALGYAGARLTRLDKRPAAAVLASVLVLAVVAMMATVFTTPNGRCVSV